MLLPLPLADDLLPLDGLVLELAPAPLPPANLANAAEGPLRPGVGGPDEPRTECDRGEVDDDRSNGGGYGAESPAPVKGGESSWNWEGRGKGSRARRRVSRGASRKQAGTETTAARPRGDEACNEG